MSNKIWIFQIPVILLFASGLWVFESGLRGELKNSFLREDVYPNLVGLWGAHTNMKFRVRGPEPRKHNIVIVEIDSDTLEYRDPITKNLKYGRWPWHRDVTANLVQAIADAGAKFIGLDIFFSEPDPRISPSLSKMLEENKLGDRAKDFETDQALENILAFNSDGITLAWASEHSCQPLYTNPEECPMLSNEAKAEFPAGFDKFALKHIQEDGKFELDKTPLLAVPKILSNIPAYNAASTSQGFVLASTDRDGYIRRVMLTMPAVDGNFYPSLPLAMAQNILKDKVVVSTRNNKISEVYFENSKRKIPVSPLGMMQVNFRGPSGSFQYVKAKEIMSDQDQILIEQNRRIASASKKELLKDAIVLVGATALGINDLRAFPFESNTPGVEGHANILDNLLSGDMLSYNSGTGRSVWIYLFMTFGALLFAFLVDRLESIPALLAFITIMSGGFLADQKVLFANGQNWNTSLLLIEITFIFFSTLAVKYVLEEKNKKFIRGAFAKYVSPAIIDSIMKDPTKLTVGGEKRDLSILFSDIRSFTSFSERMDAKQLSNFLNEYLGKMTDIVFDTGGTLDKYIGDAVMAFWGAPLDQPNHASGATRAAIAMQKKLSAEKIYFKEKYGVDVNVGIGINTGSVSVGNMGSERIFEYTCIGDHVNLASRIEGLTKDYHAPILTTRFTFDSIKESGSQLPPHRVLDSVKVKGKKNAVELIQIFHEDMNADGLGRFEEGRIAYMERRWDDAIAAFHVAGDLLRRGQERDGMSDVYIERCEEFKKNPPPANWDGAWVMTTK